VQSCMKLDEELYMEAETFRRPFSLGKMTFSGSKEVASCMGHGREFEKLLHVKMSSMQIKFF
jgi:hypothetical protein